MTSPPIISGLGEIAADYDAIICDVWGVVHDGVRPHWAACEALRRFRAERGKVVLLSNAPRPPEDIVRQFAQIGVPEDCYDAIVTSGGAARADIAARAADGRLQLMHLGPPRDKNLYEGLAVDLVGPDKAALVLLSGLYDDDNETPEDYRHVLADLKSRLLTLVCANPDVMVPRGGRLIHCAGALARDYEALGGEVVYYGKPHLPIYEAALKALGLAKRVLVIGDGIETDIKGANAARLDALFIADGLHAAEMGALTPGNLAALFAGKNVTARAAMGALAW